MAWGYQAKHRGQGPAQGARNGWNLGVAIGLVMGLLAFSEPGLAQSTATLEPADYGRWESLGPASLDPFAAFVAHRVTREDETSELRIVGIEADTTWVIPWGENPSFSADGRWLVWHVGVSPEEEQLKEDAEGAVELSAQLLDLESHELRTLGTASDLRFDPTGQYLAVLGYPPSEPEGAGAGLRVLDLDVANEVGFSDIADFAWSDVEPVLAMVLSTGRDEGNGVQLYDGRDGRVQGLASSEATFSDLLWGEGALDLAVLRTQEEDVQGADAIVWRDAAGVATRFELLARAPTITDSLEVVASGALEWSDDGSRVTIGLRPREEPDDDEAVGDNAADSVAADSPEAGESSTVQIWHSNDVQIIAEQQSRASEYENRTLLASWEPESGRVVQVGEDLWSDAWIAGDRGFERRSDPYPWGRKFGRPYHDLWTVDLDSGERVRALERVRYDWVSPDGARLVWFDGVNYQTMELGSGQIANLTEGLNATFANAEWDTPTDDFLPPYGFGGWAGESAVLLYDRFDVWKVSVWGESAERLTQGANDQVVHRMMDLHPDADTFSTNGLMFNIRSEWTEDRGVASWSTSAGYDRLVLEAKNYRNIRKADSADAVVYRRESRSDSPDYFLGDLTFSEPQLVTESNPFLDEYAWTRTGLVEYENAEATRLHGVLLYPANHDPSVTYPMIVFAYEVLSPQMHFWQGPSERSYYNYTTWTQQGYFVLLPDIVFRARDPGVSTAETLDAAIGAVDAKGLIDRERVGFIGHSWGGYEAAYLAARTELFATAVAGAPLTDFVSFMGSIHWGPGVAESDHWENGQARMAVPYWEDPDAHERNSPIHGVHTMTTPLLMAHGDADGVVEFFQATEFYNFARRAEKEMVLLVYEGEDHGFRQKANQVDYHRRILEWFAHYLKGEDAPAWITDGIAWPDHDEERARVAGPPNSSGNSR